MNKYLYECLLYRFVDVVLCDYTFRRKPPNEMSADLIIRNKTVTYILIVKQADKITSLTFIGHTYNWFSNSRYNSSTSLYCGSSHALITINVSN